MESKDLLPKRVVRYIHEMGVRSLDHLAENFEAPAQTSAEGAPNAVQALVGHWRLMSTEEKEQFVELVAVSVVEVVAASATLPLGLKQGKKAAKAAKKVIKRRTKRLRKAARTRTKTKRAAKKKRG